MSLIPSEVYFDSQIIKQYGKDNQQIIRQAQSFNTEQRQTL